jgi:small subunit ribosomal protein S21
MKNNFCEITGISVKVTNDRVDVALRKLKRLVQAGGVLRELRDRECYEKPSVARRRARGQARYRLQRQLASEQISEKLF